MKIGRKVKVSPALSKLNKWVEGKIVKVFRDPFFGEEVAVKDKLGRFFYGERKHLRVIE